MSKIPICPTFIEIDSMFNRMTYAIELLDNRICWSITLANDFITCSDLESLFAKSDMLLLLNETCSANYNGQSSNEEIRSGLDEYYSISVYSTYPKYTQTKILNSLTIWKEIAETRERIIKYWDDKHKLL